MSSNRDDSSVDYSTTDNLRAKRAKQACVNCKLHKVKCDGTVTEPCTQCIKKRIECVHSPPLKRGRKLKTEPTGEISMRQAPMLAPRNWYETAPNATHFQSRIQMFLDISQFYPFFRFQADGIGIFYFEPSFLLLYLT